MNSKLLEGLKEVVAPIAPIMILVVVFQCLIGFMEPGMMTRWIFGGILAMAGLFFFMYGLQQCLIPMGELLGTRFIYMLNLMTLVLLTFFVGALANTADPSVMVLQKKVAAIAGDSIPGNTVFLLFIVGSIGIFLVGAILRIIWNVSPALVLGIGTSFALILACFAPSRLVPLALDSGGVATGPLTVPFFLSIGLGFVSNLAKRSASTDGFGLLGIAALGPIIGILLMGIIWG